MFLAIILVVSLVPATVLAELMPPALPSGGLLLGKTAAAVGTNEYEITLSVQGNNSYSKSDIVLVMDVSGSMTRTKIDNMKAAAQSFIDSVVKSGSDNAKIGLVAFGAGVFGNDPSGTGDSAIYADLSADASYLKSRLPVNSVGGGTNIAAGITNGASVLQGTGSRSDASKYMVILSDGSPNRPGGTYDSGRAAAVTAAQSAKSSIPGINIYGVGFESLGILGASDDIVTESIFTTPVGDDLNKLHEFFDKVEAMIYFPANVASIYDPMCQ
jgi:Mg-chelatase subunit ChlD